MVKVVIDIPDYELEEVQNGSIASGVILKAVRNGTPINTDGDLISRSALKEALSQTPYNDYDDLTRTENLIDNATTVEAEKAKEGELVKAYTKGFDAGVETVRPQGEWVVVTQDNEGIHEIECPFCRYSKGSDFSSLLTVTFERFPPFCESCGAKLKSSVEE